MPVNHPDVYSSFTVALNPSPHVLGVQLIEFFQPQRYDPQHVLLLIFGQLSIEFEQTLLVSFEPVFFPNILT